MQIDIDGRLVGIRYPMEVSLVGDSRDTLRELIPHLERKEDRSWREQIEEDVERWWKILDERAHQEADEGINPLLVFHELSPRLPDRCILTADSGSATNWWARHLKLRRGMKAALSGTLATMCPGVPYAFAAKIAYPDRPGDRLARRRRDADARHQHADRHRRALGELAATSSSSCSCSTTTTSTR